MINLTHVKYFYDAVQLGSVAKAAQRNYVSAPAISQAIRSLEDQYEVQLLAHARNRFELTPFGRQFCDTAAELIQAADLAENFLTSSSGGGLLRFATQRSIAENVISTVLPEHLDRVSPCRYKMLLGTTHRCRNLLSERSVDFVVSLANVNFDAESEVIHSGRFVLVGKHGDRRTIQDAGVLVTEDTEEVVKLKNAYKLQYGEYLPTRLCVESWGFLTAMAIAGQGYAFVPDYCLMSYDRKRYRLKVCPIELGYEIRVYYSKRMGLAEPARSLISQIRSKLRA